VVRAGDRDSPRLGLTISEVRRLAAVYSEKPEETIGPHLDPTLTAPRPSTRIKPSSPSEGRVLLRPVRDFSPPQPADTLDS
jgi:hypothetical protein